MLSSFRDSESFKQYYRHAFTPSHQDLTLLNPEPYKPHELSPSSDFKYHNIQTILNHLVKVLYNLDPNMPHPFQPLPTYPTHPLPMLLRQLSFIDYKSSTLFAAALWRLCCGFSAAFLGLIWGFVVALQWPKGF